MRERIFIFLNYPDIAADNNSSERELWPIATDRARQGLQDLQRRFG